ncbi:MAG: ornithine cyclodeaminase family protein [Alphaproteobacteria bacterium]|nr:ornithine cyclodeaminase family protein [Alphaproteobacteria bacterium]
MATIAITYLSGPDIDRLALTDAEILAAVGAGLAAQGRKEAVIEPRMHLKPDPAVDGHFNVLRGVVRQLSLAGVKVVGDFHGNYRLGLPSEMGLIALFDAGTGTPRAVVDATAITAMRTGAVTAIGARHLARKDSRTLGHIGARGSAYWNVRLIATLFDLAEIRVHSARPESRRAFADRLARDLGQPVVVTDDWRSCLEGADIMVEAARLSEPEPLFKTAWVKRGALVIPYGTKSAVELSLTDVMDKVVVDDWGQAGIGPLGALRRHIDSGRVTRDSLHAEPCDIVIGAKPGRERDDETILFWHRGLSLSDIALAHAMLEKAAKLGIGHTLPYT